jgi:hypothetical protein
MRSLSSGAHSRDPLASPRNDDADRFVSIAVIAAIVVAFLTAAFENQVVTGSLLAKPHELWPVSHRI